MRREGRSADNATDEGKANRRYIPCSRASWLSARRISAGSALPLELIDLPILPSRLTVNGVLKTFDHGFEVLEAFVQDLDAPVLVLVGIGSEARFRSARAELNNHTFQLCR